LEKVILTTKEKKEVERTVKLAKKEHEKGKDKEEKWKDKGKKKAGDKALVSASSTMDQGSQIKSGVKKKVSLS